MARVTLRVLRNFPDGNLSFFQVNANFSQPGREEELLQFFLLIHLTVTFGCERNCQIIKVRHLFFFSVDSSPSAIYDAFVEGMFLPIFFNY